ncbi:MAG: ABC1 kinase family protein [Bacillota bacterium]
MLGLRGLNRRYRHIQRYRKIAEVLIRNGFGYLIDSLDLLQFIPLSRRFKLDHSQSTAELSRAERVRLTLEELGPTFIKLGQLLSTRPDLIPQEYITELTKLQDEVPPFSFDLVVEQLEDELDQPPDDLFASIDHEPLAAASIGQVHQAKLQSGEEVVIKVQRPEIQETIESDLDIIFNLATILKNRVFVDHFVDPVEIAEEFKRMITKELNYQIEGRNTDHFRNNFSDDPQIKIPQVYWEYSSQRLLTLEYVAGTKISQICPQKTEVDCQQLARKGAESFMKQVLVDGLFHGDPHPGNILVTPKEQLAFIDFGVVGRIDSDTMTEIADLFLAIIDQDLDRIVKKLLQLGMVTDRIDRRGLKQELAELLDYYYEANLEEIDISQVINQIMELSLKYGIELPSDFILLGKALMTIESVGAKLNPKFNIFSVAKPFAYRLLRRKFSPQNLFKELVSDGRELYNFLINAPRQLERILRLLENQDLRIELKHVSLEKLISKLDIVTNRLSISLIISALIVGSSYIMQLEKGPMILGFPTIGLSGFLLAGFLGLWLVISILRSGRF